MGNSWSGDTPESWQQEDVIEWKKRSIEQQKQYYNGYEGAQFHSINCAEEENLDLLKAKICYALFGQPSNDVAGNLLDGYDADQQKDATAFAEAICGLYPEGLRATVEIITLFVCFKSDNMESTVPVFRIRVDIKTIKYMDASKRKYDSWRHWLDSNMLPMAKYCYPKNGFYSCSHGDQADYNEDEYPALEMGTTPACKPGAQLASKMDVISMITSLGAGGLMIAGMATPLAAPILIGSSMAGLGAAAWGTGRSVHRLVDKKQHGESLTDLEATTTWASIVLLPMSFATAAVNAHLTNGARNAGRIFTPLMRNAATFLNCTTFTLQSGMVALGLANLVEKAEKKQLNSLDVLQFSMTVFFFTNTVMQPKTANGIIAKAQTDHIQQYRDNMTDEQARGTFDRYLKQNKGDGGIKAASKIVRSLNKIKDPDQLFNGTSGADKIKIGGRKGKTLLLSTEGSDGKPTRISVNRTFVKSTQLNEQQRMSLNGSLRGHSNTRFGKRVLDLDKMESYEAHRLDRVLQRTCRNDKRIIDAAVSLADDLDVNNVGDFCAVLEIVSRERGNGTDLTHLTGEGRSEFLAGIRSDASRAGEIAKRAEMVFDSDLKAAYHYRKHGAEFATKGDLMDYYMRALPEKLCTTQNLRNVEIRGGMIIETYCTPNGDFGVIMKRADSNKPIISTVFKNDQYMQDYIDNTAVAIEENNFNAPTPSYLNSLLTHLSGGADPTSFLRFFHIE